MRALLVTLLVWWGCLLSGVVAQELPWRRVEDHSAQASLPLPLRADGSPVVSLGQPVPLGTRAASSTSGLIAPEESALRRVVYRAAMPAPGNERAPVTLLPERSTLPSVKLVSTSPAVVPPAASCSCSTGTVLGNDSALEERCGGDHWTFMAGASLYLLKPYFQTNTAYTTRIVGQTTVQTTDTPFSWDYSVSPAVWLGVTNPDGLGLRARYFHFDQTSNHLSTSLRPSDVGNTFIQTPNNLTLGWSSPSTLLRSGVGQDQLDFSSSLKIRSLDVEAMQQWHWDCLSLLVSGGGRYFDGSQSYAANLNNTATLANNTTARELQRLSLDQRFQGGGPTLAAEGRWRVGDTGFSLFANARGSLLVGTVHETEELNNIPPTGAAFTATRQANRDNVLPIVEIEMGAEYTVNLNRVEPLVRAAVVNQTYFGSGNASGGGGNTSLFGAQFSLGMRY